jgi:hypothetical protein
MYRRAHRSICRKGLWVWAAASMVWMAGALSDMAWADAADPRLPWPGTDAIALDPGAARAALGLDAAAAPVAPPMAVVGQPSLPLQSEVSDLRVVLTQLAILAGANDHLLLLEAQASPQALVVISGAADLDTLAQLHPDSLVPDGSGGWRLLRPLVVWQGAALTLDQGHSLALSTADGAFLLVFGHLRVAGATVTATADVNPRRADFRPFLLAAGSAVLSLQDATVSDVGMSRRGLFGGVTQVTTGLALPEAPPHIRDSTFRNVGRLSLRQTMDAVVAGNRFTGGGGIEVVGGAGLAILDNLLQDTNGSFAVRLSGGVTDSILSDLTIVGPKGTGLSVGGLARRIVVADTLVDGAGGDGVSIERASCMQLTGLAVLRGQSVGLRLRASGLIEVSGSAVLGNRTTGIAIEAQPSASPLAFSDLALARNAVGIRGTGTTDVSLRDLAVHDQRPRLFDGDLAPFTAGFLDRTERQGATDFAIRLGDPAAAAAVVPAAATAEAPALQPGFAAWAPACNGG